MLRTTIRRWRSSSRRACPGSGHSFGREAIITAIQTLAFDPDIAEQTLRVLATIKATRGRVARRAAGQDPPRVARRRAGAHRADPAHAVLRHGRHDAAVPRSCSPSTPLDRRSTCSMSCAGTSSARCEWIDELGRPNGDGYVEYGAHSEKGLVNQGWKDSGTADSRGGRLAGQPPDRAGRGAGAMSYRAKLGIAELFRARRGCGPCGRSSGSRRRSCASGSTGTSGWRRGLSTCWRCKGDRALRGLVIQPRPRAVDGHRRAGEGRRTAERLMAADMFSGWGIRTLSTSERLTTRSATTWAPSGRTITASSSPGCAATASMTRAEIFDGIATGGA